MSETAIDHSTGPAAKTQPELEAERRALLGDARSVDRLDGPQLRRFVGVCELLRQLARAAGEVAPRPGAKPRVQGLDVADL